MAVIVELPRLTDTMEEGTIAQWHVAVGDKVKRGQLIAEIETDKATMDFESFDAGIVLKLVANEGDTAALGAPIAVLGKEGEDADAVLAAHGGASENAATSEANAAPIAPANMQAPAPTAVPSPIAAVASTAPTPAANRAGDRIAASPLARRLAREQGLRLEDIQGTGPHGRIVKTDVEAAAAASRTAPTGTGGLVSRPDEPQKLSQMRKTIARRMAQANAEIPQFYLTIAVNMDAAVAMRVQLKTALPTTKISFNDFVVMAAAKALVEHPEVNAYWDGQTIVRRGDVHVGVAVAVDEGLLVPPVRHADQKSLRTIAAQVRDLGLRARDKQLTPQEMTGSTFTVSNLGMFGIEEFSAVVNLGEGAILAVGAITDEAVVDAGELRIGKRMRVTLSCDHRVMDGAMGAKFLATLRTLLEQPLGMLA